MKKRSRRIYCGPPGKETSVYWTVKVSDAKQDVTINGSLKDALLGAEGSTVGCAISNVGFSNRDEFPHPCYLVSVSKRVAYVVDKLDKAGQPCHAVEYHHSYGRITEENDKGTLKQLVKEKPQIMERPFTLRTPPPSTKKKKKQSYYTGERSPSGAKPRGATFVHRGALARATLAGRVSAPVAAQLMAVAKVPRL